MKTFVFTFLFFATQFHTAKLCAEELHRIHEIRYLMGTRATITLFHKDRAWSRRISHDAFEIAERIERVISNYKAKSEISLLNGNKEKATEWLSPQMYDFLSQAKAASQETQGFFDITILPLIEYWKINEEDARTLENLRKKIGSDKFQLQDKFQVQFLEPELTLDSGGFGKGYAVDKMIEFLKASGVNSALVSLGESSIAALGSPPGKQGWNLLFQFPEEKPIAKILLKNKALSASISHPPSKERSHIFDPISLGPVSKLVRSAVLHESAAQAEALSKALIVAAQRNKLALFQRSGLSFYLHHDDNVSNFNFPLQD